MPKKEPVKKRLVVEEQPVAETAPVVVAPLVEAAVVPVVETPVLETPAAAVPAVTEEIKTIPVEESLTEEERGGEKKTVPGWVVFIVGLLLGGALGAGCVIGWMTFGNKILKKEKPAEVTVEVTPTGVAEKVTPTPGTADLKRSGLKVRVENGGGVRGAAAAASDYLTGLGYEVVSVGNSASDVTVTQVSVVKDKVRYGALLLGDLGSKYKVASTAGELTGSENFDALVIVGQ